METSHLAEFEVLFQALNGPNRPLGERPNFLKIFGPGTFEYSLSFNFMQKIRKTLRAVSAKIALPNNKQTNYYQQYHIYRTWLTPVQLKT